MYWVIKLEFLHDRSQDPPPPPTPAPFTEMRKAPHLTTVHNCRDLGYISGFLELNYVGNRCFQRRAPEFRNTYHSMERMC